MLWDLCEGNLSANATAELPQNDGDEPLFENPEDKEMLDDQEMEEDGEQSDNASEGSLNEEAELNDSDQEEEPEEEEEAKLVEDIYGRTVDAKTGKIVKGVDTSKAQQKLDKLNEESELTEEKRLALIKSIRSIFNRFAFIVSL